MAVGLRHHRAGRVGEAERIYRQVLVTRPNHAGALHLLGVVAQQSGRLDEAIELIRRAIEVRPSGAEYFVDLSSVLREKGLGDEAIAALRQAVHVKPDFAQAHYNLGNALYEQRLFDEAAGSYRRALELKPDYVNACINLGVTLHNLGLLDEAIDWLRRAVGLAPGVAAGHHNLGSALCDKGLLDEAIAALREAIRLNPELSEPYNNLASALKDQGLLDEAMVCYERAVALAPGNAGYFSNRIYAMTFDPRRGPGEILREHLRWDEVHGERLRAASLAHANVADAERRLRVGYVSPDFRKNHPVGRFMLPLLGAHDRKGFEIFCYSCGQADEFTGRVRERADHWREIGGVSDEGAAELIRGDGIDILVDLAMHMAGNRLGIFARKPAPVQVTYLAYAGTTGLKTIDYRITDRHLDPPGEHEGHYSEESIRVESYWCYQPPIDGLPTSAAPAVGAGFVTFGCLNNFCKVTAEVLATWGEILGAVADSRLVLHAKEGSHRERTREFFRGAGIDPSRVSFIGAVPLAEYMEQYERIDIGLDPFPYVGGTTTCDALWMGVPVVTLGGETAIFARGVSILSTIGLGELIAENREQYIRIAVELGGDLPRLGRLRSGLRERMEKSPLTDAKRFAREMEAAYRGMWGKWCDQREREKS